MRRLAHYPVASQGGGDDGGTAISQREEPIATKPHQMLSMVASRLAATGWKRKTTGQAEAAPLCNTASRKSRHGILQ